MTNTDRLDAWLSDRAAEQRFRSLVCIIIGVAFGVTTVLMGGAFFLALGTGLFLGLGVVNFRQSQRTEAQRKDLTRWVE